MLVALSGATAAIACSRMSSLRDAAARADDDLTASRRYIKSIAGLQGAVGGRPLAGADGVELNARLRESASAAGVGDRLIGVEPGHANRLRDSDFKEQLVFLRLEPVNLRQLATFLQDLSTRDPNCRTKSIDLSSPQRPAATPSPGDQWAADVGVAWQVYSPRAAEAPPQAPPQ